MDLGGNTGRAMGALSESFLDGLHLCLILAASLTLLAALVGAVLLRTPRQATKPAAGGARHAAPHDVESLVEEEPEPVLVGAHAQGRSRAHGHPEGALGLATGAQAVVPDGGSGPVLHGRIRDAAGAAVEGATLTLISSGGRQLGRAVALTEGRYRLDAPAAGSYRPGSVCTLINREYCAAGMPRPRGSCSLRACTAHSARRSAQVTRRSASAATGPSSSCFIRRQYGTWMSINLLDT